MADTSTVYIKTVSYITKTNFFGIERTATIRNVVPTTSPVLPTITVYGTPVVEVRVEPRVDADAVVY